MDGLKPVQEVLTVCLVFISTFSDLIKRQTFFKNVRFARVMMVESKVAIYFCTALFIHPTAPSHIAISSAFF